MENRALAYDPAAGITDDLPVMSWKADSDGRYVYFNKCLLEFTGKKDFELAGEGWLSGIHPDDRTTSIQSYYNAIHSQKPFRIEYRYIKHDGEYKWLLNTGKPVFSGKILTGYIGCCLDISEQKTLEASISNHREQFVKFVQSIPVPLYCIDMDGKIVLTNPAYRKLTNYTERELSHKGVNEIHGDKLLMWELFSKMLSGHSVNDHLTRMVCKDGKEKEVKITASNLWEEGKFIHACCFIQELENEEELKRLNKIISTVILAGKMISSSLDTGKLVQFIVNSAITVSGAEFGSFFYDLGNGTMPGRQGHAVAGPYTVNNKVRNIPVPPYWMNEQPFCINDVTRSRTWKNKKLEGIPPDLETKSYMIIPLQAAGDVKGAIYLAHTQPAMFHSYTAHALKGIASLAVIALENARLFERMRTEESRFRTVAESLPHMICTANAEGEIDYCNQLWQEYTGLNTEACAGKKWMSVIHTADMEKVNKMWEESIRTGDTFESEFRMKKASDSTYRWQLVRVFPLRDHDGKAVRWFGSFTDIDEQKKAEEQKDNFLSIASHELKTPITTIKAYIQLLLTMRDGDEARKKIYLSKAGVSVNHLNALVSDLLDVSRIEGGRMNYKITEFSLEGLISDSVENLQSTVTTHTIEKRSDVNAIVKGDKQRLEQVICNLLSNAIKYSPGKSKVTIEVRREEDHVRITVTDQGIGIAEQHHHDLFQRFYRVDSIADRFSGLGIGLYISSEIVKYHKGEIGVNSKEGQGSQFFFTLLVEKWLEK
jgi:PAS domain S-box-containing protein